MVYPEYERQKQLYRRAQARYEAVLRESESLFEQTQPRGINYADDRVRSSGCFDQIDRYLSEMDKKRVDVRLRSAKHILRERETALELKRRELRASTELHDQIYVMRYIEHRKIYQIAMRTNYSESQIYRILKKIKDASICEN